MHSLALTIEVKSHDPSGIRIEGTNVLVNYRGAYHDASNQSMRQRESLREYLRQNVATIPYIVNLLWMTGLTFGQIAALKLPRPNNVLGSDLSLYQLLETVYNLNLPRQENSGPAQYSSFTNRSLDAHSVITLLTRRIDCTTLDRKKTEQLINRALSLDWSDDLMKKQVVLRGRGGSGKTLALVRSAHSKYYEGYRSLLLTYNLALVADLRRQMAILGINDDIAARSIRVQTAHAFFMQLITAFIGIDLSKIGDEWFDHSYLPKLRELREYLQLEVISADEIQGVVTAQGDEFAWDLICIDEGQDWFDEERDVLRQIYGTSRLLIADGRDQLIRRSQRCDWTFGLQSSDYKLSQLSQCLRMKTNLVSFVNAFAERMGLMGWSLNATNSVPGGRVMISLAPSLSRNVQEQLISENQIAGNKPVDMLYCVTTSATEKAARRTRLPELLLNWGYDVWNGLDREARHTFPLSVNQFRVVHIESSRGLEGWITVVDGIDSFFSAKMESLAVTPCGEGKKISQDQIRQLALLWCLIPLTRAIDTLLIRIDDQNSEIADALLELANAFPDFASVLGD